MAERPMLEVEDLTFRYEDMAMHFDLTLAPGHCLALLGPSGAGKSTLLSLIAGFERPLAGRVVIAGEDVTGWEPARRPVPSLFQGHKLFAHLRAGEHVGLGPAPDPRLPAAHGRALPKPLRGA